ncbi:hypothetical protein [Pararobbsia alpina]|uniref:Uncharacterized protein n=1 Tax=Pararobbsia alpina TaxID=621374 RepID=A0A6S7BIN4_9BURK|nr:hypothetical protein [Pararobbsia alpina]CAB3801548.1 hypothetical protein LMG28138_05025 [Pararobbsia alpina]
MEFNASPWHTNPTQAFRLCQEHEAAGADRKPFAERSIVQHCAMFDRFTRYLAEHGLSLTTFGTDHVDSFFAPGSGFAEDTTTRIPYAKLIDRLRVIS